MKSPLPSQETSIDNHLNVRHNTAESAALLDSHETALQEEAVEQDERIITAIDDEMITQVTAMLQCVCVCACASVCGVCV